MQVGEYTALPHGSITPQTIREGTIIMIDDGCTVEGYQSDITRTFVLGKATDKMKKVFDIVNAGADRGAEGGAARACRSRRSTPPARKVVVDAGYGPGFKYFSHRLGHGMGMDGHEWPYLVKNNMFGWEQGADGCSRAWSSATSRASTSAGEFGVRLEDDMHITERRRGAVHAAVGVAREAVLRR